MENILGGLKVLEGKTETKSITEGISAELNGKFTMKRGNFSIDLYYYARLYERTINNKTQIAIAIDDWEIQDRTNAMLGDLPIDNVSSLQNELKNIGLSTLANKIGFNDDEEKQALYEVIKNHKYFKLIYGKNAILWESLTKDEQKLMELKYVCENYETCGEYYKKEVGAFYGIDKDPKDENNYDKVIPSLEVCQAKLEELSK